ncbi:MAG: hypothetical protein KGH61_03760 [Candidatus Micrarchaeota archaeon]|nr:hypothetical protein [Candidatus Micrarchaeota archaeon]MDE1848037.1 hypothetical protein [Candidatus Micrarchaeota archaeon]MDE1864732.1 hypothetical protein [Candidatus Micrarchaeota archaeon]
MKGQVEVKEIELEEAKRISLEQDKKFVWLGGPTRVSIPEILEISDTKILSIEPGEITHFDQQTLGMLDGFIFVCPHGRTSFAIAKYLKSKNMEAYSLKGGVAAIVGENY